MTTVEIHASKSYPVEIGRGLLTRIGDQVKALDHVRKVCIVSDTTVWPLYGDQVLTSLLKAGLQTCYFVIPAGEESKSGKNYLDLLSFLAENRLTRTDCIVALGGGVVGDLAGFAAATFLRGIRFVQVPTTLLAAVDSSVGGKTAIDLPSGKNLAGAFCQPSFVLCDIDTLDTLPDEIFRDGCAEVIKTAILFDPGLFATLCRDGLAFDREPVIACCVAHKRDIVHADEFDRGVRQLLNLGHTVGHCIESLSDYEISHGRSVAIGMAIVARASVRLGICPQATATRIQWLLMNFGLPTTTDLPADQLAAAARSDKKRSGTTLNLVVPKDIGMCLLHPVSVDDLERVIAAGL